MRHLTKDKCLDHEMIILPDLDLISGKEYELRFLGEHNEDTLTHIQLAAATM